MIKKQVGEEKAYTSSSLLEEVGTQTQAGLEPEAGTDTEAMRSTAYWLAQSAAFF